MRKKNNNKSEGVERNKQMTEEYQNFRSNKIHF